MHSLDKVVSRCLYKRRESRMNRMQVSVLAGFACSHSINIKPGTGKAGSVKSDTATTVLILLPLLLFVCAVVLPQQALANQTPRFDQIENATLTPGELFYFKVRALDNDGPVPGLFMTGGPVGSEFVDNGDGARVFRWTPQASQLGEYRLLFVAVDALDASLRFSQEVFLTVASAGATIPTTTPASVDLPEHVVSASPEARADESQHLAVDGNYLPRIELESTQFDLVGGHAFILRVNATDVDGSVPALIAHALPAGATFDDNGDGSRSIRWTPEVWQSGHFEIVIVAADAQRNSLRVQETIELDVVPGTSTVATAESIQDDSPGVTAAVVTEVAQNPLPVEQTPVPATPGSLPQDLLAPAAGSGNRAPYFEGLTNQVVALGQTLEFVVAPKDPDGDVPGMFPDRLPARSSFKDNFDGTRTLSWRPFPVDTGDFWITFTALDARDSSIRTSQSMKITVEDRGGYNFEPVINGINNPVIRVGDTLQQKVQPVDPDGDVPRLSVLNPPPGSDFVDNRDGTRTLVWNVHQGFLTEINGDDQPHLIDFLAVDARDESLRDDHQIRVSVVEPGSLARSGERLRTLAERKGILLGFAAMLESAKLADTDLYRDIAREEFNIVTPENSHKWGWIQPFPGQFDFEDADELANYALNNGMVLHGHPLIWHRQLPAWVQTLPLDQAESAMLSHIDALVSRYRGKVAIWDVINEALEEDGTFRDSVWFKSMGVDYIRKAFLRARAADPEAVLVYNDYDVAWTGPKSDGMYRLLQQELARGTPIDAVGFQMHFWTQFDQYDDMRANLQRFADLGLDIYITEFDVAMTADAQEQQQAEVFERVMEICLEQPACKAIQAWGFTDRYSWRYNHRPLMFTERYKAKPAYYAWQRALQR